jgi:hypothetical protein
MARADARRRNKFSTGTTNANAIGTCGDPADACLHGPNARRGMGSTFGPHADP